MIAGNWKMDLDHSLRASRWYKVCSPCRRNTWGTYEVVVIPLFTAYLFRADPPDPGRTRSDSSCV